MRDCLAEQAILSTNAGFGLLPANGDLTVAEVSLMEHNHRETFLKSALEPVRELYDYVLIDCPPSLGLLTLNVLTLVREIFIPLQTEFFALQGVSKLLDTHEVVRKRLNKNLEITGIIFCMYTSRTRLCKEVIEKVKEHFAENQVFSTVIRKNVKLSESPSHGKPIISYAPGSHGSEDYMALAKEVVQQENSKKY